MKYIKTYENKQQEELWVVTSISSSFPELNDLQIFDDEQSAENYFINMVNEIAIDDGEVEDTIFTIEEALDYCTKHEYAIDYEKVIKIGKYELPEELKIGRDAKKYNL